MRITVPEGYVAPVLTSSHATELISISLTLRSDKKIPSEMKGVLADLVLALMEAGGRI